MEQKSKYDIEIENFRHNFSGIKNKRIAIYGMGRRSATLLPGITDFNIAGILDRDESNVGKELCGIKVISIKNVEAAVDVIIINSDPSNYEIIYKRIAKNITVPVYYADGRLACLSDEDTSYERNGYWKSSYKELKDKIDRADAVSFDIFDTLIMRKIFSPEDVFRLLGEKVRAELKLDCEIAGIRAQAAAKCGSNATINEIYKQIKKTNLTDTNIAGIKTKGYCFYACLAKDNVYTNDISMYACFQYGDDYTAEKSFARKKNMYIETFITAPHGMIRYIDNQGKMICKPDGKSQEYFDIKEKVNCGAVDFIVDYMNIYKTVLTVNSMEYIKLMQDRRESFEDNLFYNMLNGMCNVSNNILEGFYFDNDFVGGKEIKLEI